MSINTPSNIEATPSYVNVIELHDYLYDKYANYYNENFVDGQAKLLSILGNLDKIRDSQMTQIQSDIENLRTKFDEKYSKLAEQKNDFPKDYRINSFNDFKKKKDTFFLIIRRRFKIENAYYFNLNKRDARAIYGNLLSLLRDIHVAVTDNNYRGAFSDEILLLFRSYAKITRIETNKRVLSKVINKILETGYQEPLKTIEEMTKYEQEKLHEDVTKYIPHHNTRKGLVDDLRKIIEEIKSNPHYFNEDGSIKHVSVSKYAVDKKWFSKKYNNPTHEGLHKHVKKIYSIEYQNG